MSHELIHELLDGLIALVLVPGIWGVIKLYLVLRIHVPHTHDNGKIIYSQDFPPPQITSLRRD